VLVGAEVTENTGAVLRDRGLGRGRGLFFVTIVPEDGQEFEKSVTVFVTGGDRGRERAASGDWLRGDYPFIIN